MIVNKHCFLVRFLDKMESYVAYHQSYWPVHHSLDRYFVNQHSPAHIEHHPQQLDI